uniref:Uncharacterized protein n=1 Tax=Schistosoma japonicum TaxID=6182 RepID=Q5C2G8_SCHJA|nr:unknown [Schistosoma japonicum]
MPFDSDTKTMVQKYHSFDRFHHTYNASSQIYLFEIFA